MNKIDTNGWEPFRICDIFETEGAYNKLYVPTGSWLPVKKLKDGTTPRITVSGLSNGVSGYYSDIEDDNYRVYENFISVSFLGTVFYQSGKASLDMKVHCLKPIKYTLNENVACFLISVIRRAVGSVEYSDQISSSVLPYIEILLPATQSGSPDWAYMDSFMQNVMNESKACLGNLRLAKASISSVDISKWKDFEIGKLFKIIKPSVFHTRQVVEDDEGIPYVVRTKFNNGIKFRVVKTEDMSPSPSGVISFGSENATFFYQPEEFVSGRDIYYLDTQGISERTCQFMAACLQPIARKYSYNYGLFPDLLKQEHIKLPADSDGKPDWVYMDLHMETILTQSKKLMDALKEVTL